MIIKKFTLLGLMLFCLLQQTWCNNVKNIKLNIKEEEPAGLVIGSLELMSSNVTIEFSNDSFSLLVEVNVTNGNIITKKTIDRENLVNGVIDFIVLNGTELNAYVEIIVEDINDNAPKFPTAEKKIDIKESEKVGKRYRLPVPIDLDSSWNGYIRDIRIIESQDVFALDYEANIPYLVLLKTIDYEKEKEFLLSLIATDAGKPSLSGESKLRITILDINDNKPNFTETDIKVHVYENATVPSFLSSVKATDKDSGKNGQVSYQLTGNGTEYFEISAKGNVKLIKPLRYDVIPLFNLTVIATDQGKDVLSSSTRLTIFVMDTNNNLPEMFIPNESKFEVSENSPINSSITIITVCDEDTIEANGFLTLKIIDTQYFRITEDSVKENVKFGQRTCTTQRRFTVQTMKMLDYENEKNFLLNIEATDNIYRISKTINIAVTDVNDNKPEMTKNIREISVPIDIPHNSFIYKFTATDKDTMDIGRLKYNITSPNDFFNLDSNTGVLVTKKKLDMTQDMFMLNISVTDFKHTTYSTASIRVSRPEKKKLCRPNITEFPGKMTMTQKTPMRSLMGKYLVTNCKDAILSLIQNPELLFELSDGGELVLVKRPTVEGTFAINIMASNRYNFNLNVTVSTSVSVKMEKDFNFPRGLYEVSQYEIHQSRLPITRVNIEGTDIKYSTIGIQDKKVTMDENTGSIYVHQNVAAGSCLFFAVLAKNSAQQQATTHVVVTKRNQNHHGNVRFQREEFSFQVWEHYPTGSFIGHVLLDNPNKYPTRFFIQNGNERGVVSVSNEGYITVNKSLDRQIVSEIVIDVVVLVNCGTISTKVRIKIIDVNDNPPIFQSPKFVVIDTNIRPPIVVYKAIAHDIDFEENSRIQYNLLDNGFGHFCINENNGAVHLIRTLDVSQSYRLKIRAYDSGKVPLYKDFNLYIMVKSVQSKLQTETIFLTIDVKPYTPFHRIQFGEKMKSNVYILQEHQNTFGIYSNGWLYLKNESARIGQEVKYNLTVTDANNTMRKTIVVFIQRNTESVIFQNSTFIFNISENHNPLSSIGEIKIKPKLTDPLLFIEVPDGRIALKGRMLKLQRRLDCNELKKDYGSCQIILQTQIVTTDMNDTCIIVIRVFDTNNHGPFFESNFISIAVDGKDPVFPKQLIRAIDKDITKQNSEIEYQIVPNTDFSFNKSKGVIITKSLPLEKQKYELKVTAFDLTNTTKYDVLELEINVINEAPRRPILSVKEISLLENTTVGTIIQNIRDLSNQSGIIYHLVDTGPTFPFIIHPSLGKIQVVKPLDYETKRSYVITVVANNSVFSTKENVNVDVININDNAPTSNYHNNIEIDDTTQILIAQACNFVDKDGDSLEKSMLVDSELKEYLEFIADSCQIKLLKSLEPLDKNQVEIKFGAFDGLYQTFSNFTITILRKKNPVILSPAAVPVKPDVGKNDKIHTMKVTKPFAIQGVIFSVEGDSTNYFSIGSNTGDLHLKKEWPNNTSWFFNVNIKVTSQQGKMTTQTLFVFKETNKNVGLNFAMKTVVRAVTENNERGKTVTNVTAYYEQAKTPLQTQIKYYITSGNIANSFSIVRKTELIVAKGLDREKTGDKVDLVVYAVDTEKGIPHTAKMKVQIFVYDQNDNKPEFSYQEQVVFILENTQVPYTVIDMKAEDKDNDIVNHTIESGSDNGKFTIDIKNGTITLNQPLDHETEKIKILKISATDGRWTVQTTLKIYVTDVNDNTPVFIDLPPLLQVDESTPVKTDIKTITANDPDSGMNGNVHYSILSGSFGYFDIDPVHGNTYVNRTLNSQAISFFVLNISASDHGMPKLTKIAKMFIRIHKKNVDQKIKFTQSSYHVSLPTKFNDLHILTTQVMPEISQLHYYYLIGKEADQFSVTEGGKVYLKERLQESHLKTSYRFSIAIMRNSTKKSCLIDAYAFVNITVAKKHLETDVPLFMYVSENSENGTVIGELDVCDNHTNVLCTPAWNNTIFQLAQSKQIVLVDKLDHEMKNEYNLLVNLQTLNHKENKTIRILVRDENDNAPVFQQTQGNVTIPSDISTAFKITQIKAKDADSNKNGQITYKLLTHLNVFEIDSQNGIVTVRKNVTLKKNQVFGIEVLVFDHGCIPRNATTTFWINIIETNKAPKFTELIYNAQIRENFLPSVPLLTVNAYDENSDTNLTYKIKKFHPSNTNQYLTLGSLNGEIRIKKEIDREFIPNFKLTIEVLDNGLPQMTDSVEVNIKILDENDQTPRVFYPSDFIRTIQIPENTPPNTTFASNINVIDGDEGLNGTTELILLNHKSLFKFDSTTGITTLTTLDHEVATFYDLNFKIRDLGTPYRESVSFLRIRIMDLNDSPPKFITPPGQIYISQNSPVGSFVTQLSVNDADSLISKTNFFSNMSIFQVERQTGIVTLQKTLNTNEMFSYNMTAFVQDSVYVYLNDTITVRFQVKTESLFPKVDQKPLFTKVTENDETFIKRPLIHVKVGSMGNEYYQFKIASLNTNLFRINSRNGSLYLKRTLDYEAATRHTIWVSISNTTTPEYKSHIKVIVYVANENDNTPSIIPQHRTIHVPENSIDIFLTAVKAIDLDGDDVFYSIDDVTNFSINKTSGDIYRKIDFDYEKDKEYSLRVYASDNKTTSQQSYLFIKVINVNDNVPVVSKTNEVEIYENAIIYNIVYKIEASDEDKMGPLLYTLNDTRFEINKFDGVIKLLKSLDRETEDVINLNISVSDGEHVNTAELFIFVLDINDSPPYFGLNEYILPVQENATDSSVVHTFRARDDDIEENSKSQYLLTNENALTRQSLYLERHTGELKLLKSIRINGAPISFNFQIKARNIQPPHFTTVTNVTVNVVDVNDNHPIFNQSKYTTFISTKTQSGSIITTVKATDNLDIGINARISYNITGGNGSSLFNIDSSGTIKTMGDLNMRFPQLLIIEVTATDHGIPSKDATCFVHVYIEVENLKTPFFTNEVFTFTVLENNTIHENIFTVTADDFETKQILFFSVITGNEENVWNISNNGALSLNKYLDYETKKTHLLTIQILDGTFGNQKSANKTFTINVLDVNDNAPKFTKLKYNISVPEDFNISRPLLKMEATDNDSSQNGKVSYKIIGEERSLFWIEEDSGALYSKHLFDYENNSRLYTVKIEVVDNGENPKKATTNVKITILNVNECKPKLSSGHYFFNISRIQSIPFIVGSVSQIDNKNNESCLFEIAIGNDIGISIDQKNGNIIMTRKLPARTYKLPVTIFHPNPDITAYDTGEVEIELYNEEVSPAFSNQLYKASVEENKREMIVHVSAIHYDGVSGMVYELVGEGEGIFQMNRSTGEIYVDKPLDYETKRHYDIRISARKQNSPKAYANVSLTVVDVNDNRPTLGRCYGEIPENIKPGRMITIINATDIENPPNAGPFKFSLTDTSDSFEIDAHTGEIRTKKIFDFEKKNLHKFTVTVSDNGTLPLSSIVNCTVKVTDVNDNRGISRKITALTTTLSVLNHRIGDVSPIDYDSGDVYNCSLMKGKESQLYFLNGCEMFVGKEEKGTNLSATYLAQTGNYTIVSSINVLFRHIRTIWYNNHVFLRLSGVNKHFVAQKVITIETFVNNLMQPRHLSCLIFTVQNDAHDGVIVGLVVYNPTRSYTIFLQDLLIKSFGNLAQIIGLNKTKVELLDPCKNNCETSGRICTPEFTFAGFNIINTPSIIFHSQNVEITEKCKCPAGYEGRSCTIAVKSCHGHPCFNGGTCNEDVTVNCKCPKYFYGDFCEKDVDECNTDKGSTTICQNGGKCVNKHGGFYCQCQPLFYGEFCEKKKTLCEPTNPCQNNGTCTENSNGTFTCECLFGDFGKICERRSLNFRPAGYLKVNQTLSMDNFLISFYAATVENNSLLLLAYDGNETSLMMTVENGEVKCVMLTSTTSIIVKNNITITDGKFHRVELKSKGETLEVTIDKQEKKLKTNFPTGRPVLFNYQLFGGVNSMDLLLQDERYKQYITTPEFIGYMKEIMVNELKIATSSVTYYDSVGVEVGGKRRGSVCLDNPCGYGSKCIDRWNNYECLCNGEYLAKGCLRDYRSLRLPDESSTVQLSLTESQRRKNLMKVNTRKRRDTQENSFAIEFRTRDADGILLNSTDSTSSENTLIQIINGFMVYNSTKSNNNGDITTEVFHKLDDGAWHSLAVSTMGKTVSITLDGYHFRHTFTRNTHMFMSDSNSFELGRNFKGCIGKLNVNKETLYLTGSTSMFEVSASMSTELGCVPSDVCSNSPCENETVKNYCVDRWEDFECMKPGLCKTNNPCQNSGQCVPGNSSTAVSCNCIRTQYGGRSCETPLVCLLSPCGKNQQCLVGNPTYKCVDKNIDNNNKFFEKLRIIVIALSAFFLFLVMLCVIIILARHRKKAYSVPNVVKDFEIECEDLDKHDTLSSTHSNKSQRKDLFHSTPDLSQRLPDLSPQLRTPRPLTPDSPKKQRFKNKSPLDQAHEGYEKELCQESGRQHARSRNQFNHSLTPVREDSKYASIDQLRIEMSSNDDLKDFCSKYTSPCDELIDNCDMNTSTCQEEDKKTRNRNVSSESLNNITEIQLEEEPHYFEVEKEESIYASVSKNNAFRLARDSKNYDIITRDSKNYDVINPLKIRNALFSGRDSKNYDTIHEYFIGRRNKKDKSENKEWKNEGKSLTDGIALVSLDGHRSTNEHVERGDRKIECKHIVLPNGDENIVLPNGDTYARVNKNRKITEDFTNEIVLPNGDTYARVNKNRKITEDFTNEIVLPNGDTYAKVNKTKKTQEEAARDALSASMNEKKTPNEINLPVGADYINVENSQPNYHTLNDAIGSPDGTNYAKVDKIKQGAEAWQKSSDRVHKNEDRINYNESQLLSSSPNTINRSNSPSQYYEQCEDGSEESCKTTENRLSESQTQGNKKLEKSERKPRLLKKNSMIRRILKDREKECNYDMGCVNNSYELEGVEEEDEGYEVSLV